MEMPKRYEPTAISLCPSEPATEEQLASWVEIENGRYMPRRIRGSCLGRELG